MRYSMLEAMQIDHPRTIKHRIFVVVRNRSSISYAKAEICQLKILLATPFHIATRKTKKNSKVQKMRKHTLSTCDDAAIVSLMDFVVSNSKLIEASSGLLSDGFPATMLKMGDNLRRALLSLENIPALQQMRVAPAKDGRFAEDGWYA